MYVKEGTPSREINSHPQTSKSFDVTVVELNFRKSKWLLINTYKLASMNNILFCEEMSGLVDFYSQNYKYIVIMGDFNMQTDNSNFRTFYEREKYRQQRNYWVKFRNEARKQYFSNLDPTYAGKSGFWDAVGPVFSNKTTKKSKRIILVEQNEIISDDSKVTYILRKSPNL